jgi:hypothetical protein
MKNNKLSQWLYQNRCFLTSDNSQDKSHLCLDGGKLNIVPELITNFYCEYANALKNGDRVYICEVISPIIQMYVDMDFFTDNAIESEMIRNVSIFCKELIDSYFKASFDLTVCTSASKEVQKNKKKQIKTGVHIIFHELYVTVEQGYSISKLIIDEVKVKYPEFDWENIIDDQVYHNGLRMIGSRKIVSKKRSIKSRAESNNSDTKSDTKSVKDCSDKDCSDKDCNDKDCSDKDNDKDNGKDNGKEDLQKEYELIKVDEGRDYWPILVIGDTISDVKSLSDCSIKEIVELLQMCCIRTYHGERPLAPVAHIKIYPFKKSKDKRSDQIDTNVDSPEIFERVEQFIRYQTIIQWDSKLRQLKKHDKFYIAKIDSMYCLNIQREHNSCGIYFHISEQGMVQRCFCRCDTLEGRKNGLCSKYKSIVFPLPAEVKNMLFPNSKMNKRPIKIKTKVQKAGHESFGSNTLLKPETIKDYLRMTYNTILELELGCQ